MEQWQPLIRVGTCCLEIAFDVLRQLWMLQVGEKWAVSRRVQNVRVAKGYGLFHWYPDSRAWWLQK